MSEETIGRDRNTHDEVNRVSVAVNSSTAQVLFVAEERRIEVIVSNISNQDCLVRFQAASVDDVPRDVLVVSGSSKTVTGGDNVYIGEISVIMAVGGTKIIVAVEL